jgi:hypothetical protein
VLFFAPTSVPCQILFPALTKKKRLRITGVRCIGVAVRGMVDTDDTQFTTRAFHIICQYMWVIIMALAAAAILIRAATGLAIAIVVLIILAAPVVVVVDILMTTPTFFS